MEQEVIKNFKSGSLISYHRYADDFILIIKKNFIRSFFREINEFDAKLKLTMSEIL